MPELQHVGVNGLKQHDECPAWPDLVDVLGGWPMRTQQQYR
jgi:hypothetical protein